MSDFIPIGLKTISEAVTELGGLQNLGSGLAGGLLKAVRMNAWGQLFPLDEAFWRGQGARLVLEAGHLVERRGGKGDAVFIVLNEDYVEARKILSPPREHALPEGVPEWWPGAGEKLVDWASSARVETEAEGRLRLAETPITEAQVIKQIEDMWREADGKAAEGTVGRVRRRERKN